MPAGALSPPATLSPPSSPSVHPHCPWSPSSTGPSVGTVLGHQQPQAHDRLSAFSLVSGYAGELQRLPTLPAGRGELYVTLNSHNFELKREISPILHQCLIILQYNKKNTPCATSDLAASSLHITYNTPGNKRISRAATGRPQQSLRVPRFFCATYTQVHNQPYVCVCVRFFCSADMRSMMYGGYGSVAAVWWAHHAVASGLLLPHSGFPAGQTARLGPECSPPTPGAATTTATMMMPAGPPSPAMGGGTSPTRRCTPEKAKFREYTF